MGGRRIGISIFPGWTEIFDEQLKLVDTARDLGFSEIFFGIGLGTHWSTSITESFGIAKKILAKAGDFYTFVDINPEILSALGSSPRDLSRLKEAGFKGVRADYGFSRDEIVEMSKQMIVELNPMEVSMEDLDYVLGRADPERIRATHNYYPARYTGLSLAVFKSVTEAFKSRGVEVGAFISHPGYQLRTTLEILREAEPFDAANFLFKYVDRVLIGDPVPRREWLSDVATVAKAPVTPVRIKLYAKDPEVLSMISQRFRVNRWAEYAVTCRGGIELKRRCYTRLFRGAVAALGKELWVFLRDLGIGPFTLVGELDEVNIEVLLQSSEVTFIPR